MKKRSLSRAFLATPAIIFSFSAPAVAQDDGARAYWKGRAGTHAVSFQYLPMFMDAEGSKPFAPGQYIYPNSNIEAMSSWLPMATTSHCRGSNGHR